MYWFRFEIPLNSDGTRVTYSPGWHGEMPRCPDKVTVLLYNDKEGYGIAQTDDTFVPKEVKVITEIEATKLMSTTKQTSDVFVGVQKITDRWTKQEVDRLAEIATKQKTLYDAAIEEVLNG